MYYPWWVVPGLTAPMVVAIVAVVHVLVAHYAVGGGILLALENAHALRTKDMEYRNYWKKQVRFFVLLTVAFGAITGVGIWWTIGLASPLATELLIRTFVFGWAIEWVFFILEITAAFGFYYFWDRMKPRTHILFGWIYALSAWISLVLITGITAYMLNSRSLFGDWAIGESGVLGPSSFLGKYGFGGDFWAAFFNVQFIPQTVIRTGGALVLATFYVYLHAAIFEKSSDVRGKIARRTRVPAMFGIVLIVLGSVGWFWFLPESSLMTLERTAAMNIFVGLFAATLAGATLLIILGPFGSPKKTSVAFATALFLFGIVGVSTGEFIREAVRKPFVVDQKVYGNQVFVDEIEKYRCDGGVLYEGIWTRLYLDRLQEQYPELKIAADRFVYEKYEFPVPVETDAPESPSEPGVENPTETIPSPGSPNGTKDASPSTTNSLRPVSVETVADDVASNEFGSPVVRGTQASGRNLNANASQAFQPISTNRSPSGSATGSQSTSAQVPQSASALAPQSTPALIPQTRPATQPGVVSAVYPASNQEEPPRPLATVVPETVESEKIVADNRIANLADGSKILPRRGNPDLLKVSDEDRVRLGEVVFVYHCNDCHAAARGYSAVGPLLTGKTRDEIVSFVHRLNRPGFYMLPWLGSDVEAELLADYLTTIQRETPKNIRN